VAESNVYASDKANGIYLSPTLPWCIANIAVRTGATILSIAVGHQIDTLTYILGDFATISATATTAYRESILVDKDDKPTGKTINSTSPDHITITGWLTSEVLASII
jgi:hypothetical protein